MTQVQRTPSRSSSPSVSNGGDRANRSTAQRSNVERVVSPARPSSRPTAYRRPRRRHPLRRVIAGVFVAVLAATGLSVASALRGPGDDTATKLAEWARDHGFGIVVTSAETVQYLLHPPTTGGQPDLAVLAPGARQSQSGIGNSNAPASSIVPALPRLVGPATPALPGEGVWVTTAGSSSRPLVRQTYVRPDTVHTSYLAGVAWMSHRLSFVLHPGYQDPGTRGFSQPDMIPPNEYSHLVATFNGGFKLADARGGFYDHGTTIGSLTVGAASFVVYADGHATVGTWGRDVSLTGNVVYVRQNLEPLISNGQIAANVDSNVQSNWGATVGGGYAVWRSGIGVTASGDLVYVAGDALTVSSLADLLKRAGSVNAMQLDINKSWVSYMTYTQRGSHVTPHKLVPFLRSADRYLSPASRDFLAAYAR